MLGHLLHDERIADHEPDVPRSIAPGSFANYRAVIECDELPDKKAGEELRALDWVRWTRRLDKVSGG